MHQPVHPHSRPAGGKGGQDSSGSAAKAKDEPSDRPVGPFSASAEKGYRPATRTSVPNPYTNRRLEVDDVEPGAHPVGQWRGAGLDEPTPRGRPRTPNSPLMNDSATGAAPRPAPGSEPGATDAAADERRKPAAPARSATDAERDTHRSRHNSELPTRRPPRQVRRHACRPPPAHR
ncbi:hypothetical protein [Nocardiopsis sp. CNR-923]|uniref:hypothetical protein n=1 Tax=Nocardiopsis sp. CNR-923 TaxID=1904965 RepID=UPI00117F0A3C|nr:hypothetical protein [Nocardiopsis sp. CNR-923]